MESKKRRLKVPSLEERISVINDHRQGGLSSRKLAEKYACGITQINQVLTNTEILLKTWEENKSAGLKRKRKEKYPEINEIHQAAVLINNLDDSKFPLLLARIIQKLHLKEDIFTKEEAAKLEISLSVSQDELKLILQTLTFIFQQASYHLSKPAVLSQQLQNIEISEKKTMVITQAWINNAGSITEKMKKKTITSKQLIDVNWELRLQLAQSTMSKLKKPVGLLELTLDSSSGPAKVNMEFTHDELYSIYNQLETVQSQLDSLR